MNLPADLQAVIGKLHGGVIFDNLTSAEQRLALTATGAHVVDNMFALINATDGVQSLEWARALPEAERNHHAKEAWTAEMLGEPVQVGAMACLVVSQVAAGKFQLDAFTTSATT